MTLPGAEPRGRVPPRRIRRSEEPLRPGFGCGHWLVASLLVMVPVFLYRTGVDWIGLVASAVVWLLALHVTIAGLIAHRSQQRCSGRRPLVAGPDGASTTVVPDRGAVRSGPAGGSSPRDVERALQVMAEWLAHPREFGESPSAVRLLGAYRRQIFSLGDAPVTIFLIAYEMPSGAHGRGFVNPITWSFVGDEMAGIPDDDLVTAYTGWVLLSQQVNDGSIKTAFAARTRASFMAFLERVGVSEVRIGDQYLVGDEEVFEFTGRYEGRHTRGAGNEDSRIFFVEGMPQMHLPPIYWLLGAMQAQG